jgi:hypothetical protein
VKNESRNKAGDAFGPDGKGSVGFDEARLWFERTFGENDEYFFAARLRNDDKEYARFDRFFVEMPFFFDTKMTVGRFNWALEGDYKISLPETGGWTGDQILTDWTLTGFGVTKNFGLGMARIAVAHPNKLFNTEDHRENVKTSNVLQDWMILAGASFQFTEQIGLDLGGQAFIGDNAEYYQDDTLYQTKKNPKPHKIHKDYDWSFNNLWTVYAGLRFNFNENIGFRGTFYHQKMDTEEVYDEKWRDSGYLLYLPKGNRNNWSLVDVEDANHWAVIVDVKQAALKYTSVWLEYGQFDQGFRTMNDGGIFYSPLLQEEWGVQADTDIKYWRVGLGQEWNDKWSTYLFYYGYNISDGRYTYNKDTGDILSYSNVKPKEYGVGVQYKLNDYTTMGLNYMHAENDMPGENERKDNVVRFRTKVTF